MEDERFDSVIRALGNGASRRGVLGLLAGATALGVGEVAGKRRKRGKGRGVVRSQGGNPSKVALCHYDAETDTFHKITVDNSAVQKHVDNHGDFFPAAEHGCCTDADCGQNETCVVDAATNTASCQSTSATCNACDVNQPCNSRFECGQGGSCQCWVRADRSGCHCGPIDQCSNHAPCGENDSCPDEQVCIENCCGKLCYASCDAATARAAASSSATDGPNGIR